MISQAVLGTIAKLVAVGGLMAAGGGGVYFVATRTSDEPAKQTIVAATDTPTAADTATPASTATATPPSGSIFVSDLKRLSPDLVSPAFSPDGSKILGGDKAGLEVGAADGSGLRAIEPDVTSAVWSPDSNKLAVTVVHRGLTSVLQSADLVVMNADGSSRIDVGKSDFPTYVQFLTDGRLAYVRDEHLHLLDTTTGVDTNETQASPIVNDDPALDIPFLVSGDGQFIATMHGTVLSVQNLVSGENKQLTDAIDPRRWSGYGWSPAGVLAYADVNSKRIPALHLFDPTTGSERVLLQGKESGEFSGVSWSTPDWLIFVFYPSGTVAEELAEYRAVNVTTGISTLLVTNGLGFTLSAGGRKLIFTRSASSTDPFSQWVATLAVQ